MSNVNSIDENRIVQAVIQILKENQSVLNSETAADEVQFTGKDITAIDEREICLVENPKNKEAILRLKQHMPAKTATGRAGDRDKTFTMFRKNAALAAAVDAVWAPLNMDFVKSLDIPITRSLPATKEEYLRRPDLGRLMDDDNLNIIRTQLKKKPDVQIVIGEGQSNSALEKGLPEILPALEQGLKEHGIDYGTPVFVEFTRVGIGDLICQEVGAKMVLVILGERPGLIDWSSLSCYMTYDAKPGILESKRTVVSNINDDGTPAAEAGAYVADLIKTILEKKMSGVDLVL